MHTAHRSVCIAVLCLFLIIGGVTPVTADTGSEYQAESGDVIIDDSLQNATGEQRVIVELQQLPDDDEVTQEALQAHANETQEPFERFANETEHVDIENQFWISNQILVTVDVDKVPLERLGEVDYVVGIFEEADDEEIYPQDSDSTDRADPAVEPTDDTIPGFGVAVSLLALVLVAFGIRHIAVED